MGLKGLRLWLFQLCQSRSGQCLRPAAQDKPHQPGS